jgi:hypothetical protein
MATRYGGKGTSSSTCLFENIPSDNTVIIHIENEHNKTIQVTSVASDLSLFVIYVLTNNAVLIGLVYL